MSMSPAMQNFVRRTQNASRNLLDVSGEIAQMQVLWSGTPDYDAMLTQEDIDALFPGAGLTVQAVADAQYALALIGGNVQNALVALTVLANLP